VSEVDSAQEIPASAAAGTTRLREWPQEELPREKLDRHGAAALTDAELLALFFGTGTKGLNVIEMSRLLLSRYGTLTELSRLSPQELQSIPGIGEAKAKHLSAAFELGKRLAHQTYSQQSLETPELIHELIGADLRAQPRETIRIILLNTRYRLQKMEDVALGTINECLARPADILRPALVHQAFAFVLAHNHPSGDVSPSDADRRLTRRLKEAADLLGVRFLDHLIIGRPATPGGEGFFSFRAAGLL